MPELSGRVERGRTCQRLRKEAGVGGASWGDKHWEHQRKAVGLGFLVLKGKNYNMLDGGLVPTGGGHSAGVTDQVTEDEHRGPRMSW